MDRNVVEAIDKAVEDLREELVEFAKEIIAIDTENPPGKNYPQCAKAIGAMMEKIGCEVEYVEVPADQLDRLAPLGEGLPRVNVIGRYRGKEGRPLLHFSGHYDVVPAGSDWTVDPFKPEVKDGKLYGRGSSDQKSGIVSQIFAIYALKKAGISLNGTIISSATPDEETGGQAGVGYLVNNGYLDKNNTDYCIITECLDYDKICLGHRGTFWFEIETKGKQSHGSMPSEGINAIDHMNLLLNAIKEKIQPELAIESEYPVIPPACKRSTLVTTMINAGTKVNTVPGSCVAAFDWRLIPEQSVAWAKERILSTCEELKASYKDFDYELRSIMEVDPTIVSGNTDVVKAFQKAGETYLGKVMDFSISPGNDDQKYVVRQGGMDQCIVYGPGPLRMAHKSDEYVEVEHMIAAAKVMALAATDLLSIV